VGATHGASAQIRSEEWRTKSGEERAEGEMPKVRSGDETSEGSVFSSARLEYER